jgi:hypothetical protein
LKAIACGIFLTLLQACSIPTEKSVDPPTIIGAWLPLKDWSVDLCETSAPARYYRDGNFRDSTDIGRWQISGSILTETITGSSPEQMYWSPEDIGKPFVSKIEWVDQSIFLKHYASGEVVAWRRCPASN